MPSHQSPLMPNKLWVVIPAAGSGRRFSQSKLKQYQLLDHKTVLEHTVERLNGLDLAGYVLA
ncbi:MAG TPA: 2-C-methyl-D-erythritol 4-phosphate cytidylyltransferase, partial [Acinetobacter sp.]|nr:2-C-methyl-D-erythritol 4-phosphate cytidylyltransferase [Acinetobacter sp.]